MLYDTLKKILQAKGYLFYEDGQFNLNIIGVRSETSKSNAFDDMLYVAYKDANYQPIVKEYNITTDPGKPWLLKPMDPGGCAVMAPGQYVGAYMLGIHGRSKPPERRYEALEQVKPIRYVRDNNRDDVIDKSLFNDPSRVFSAILKTNIHRASRYAITRAVETYSAGCQVFADPVKFDEFLSICRIAKGLHGNAFTYTLLNESDFK